MKIGIILTPNSRSNAYLRKLLELKIELADIVFMNDKSVHAFSHEEISKSTEYGFDIRSPKFWQEGFDYVKNQVNTLSSLN